MGREGERVEVVQIAKDEERIFKEKSTKELGISVRIFLFFFFSPFFLLLIFHSLSLCLNFY